MRLLRFEPGLSPWPKDDFSDNDLGVESRTEDFLIQKSQNPIVDDVLASRIYEDVEKFSFDSIKEAVRQIAHYRQKRFLKAKPPIVHDRLASVRRGELILQDLRPQPKFSKKIPTEYQWSNWKVERPLLGFSLLGQNQGVIGQLSEESLLPIEAQIDLQSSESPSAAAAKLIEAMRRISPSHRIKPNDRVLDLGCHPGGWAWAALENGANVLGVDRVAFDSRFLNKYKNRLDFKKQSAFDKFENYDFDWIISDVIAETDRLLSLFEQLVQNSDCSVLMTIKLKGDSFFNTRSLLSKILGLPRVCGFRLNSNKHEFILFRHR